MKTEAEDLISTVKELVHCPPERDLADWLKAMDEVCTAASGVMHHVYTSRDRKRKTWIIRNQEQAEALDQALNRLLPH